MANEFDSQKRTQQFADDYKRTWQDKISPQELDAELAPYTASDQTYAATGLVKSVGVYAWFTINVQFRGAFKGWATPFVLAEGPLDGTITTPDFSALTSRTQAFYFWMTLGYIHITFYDTNGVNLGYFAGSSYGVVAAGGGPGSWNQ